MMQLFNYHKKKIFFLCSLVIVFALLVICSKNFLGLASNPYDPDYAGDYRIEVKWDALPETLEVFGKYEVEYTEPGKDSVIKAWVEGEIPLKAQVKEKPEKIVVCPLSIGSSKIYIKGLRHNEKVIACSSDVIYKIVNPYYLEVDSATLYGCKEGFDVRIKRRGYSEVPSSINKWYVNGIALLYGSDSIYRVNIKRPTSVLVKGSIEDSIFSVDLDSFIVEAKEVVVPSIDVYEKVIEVVGNREIKINGIGNAEKYVWKSIVTGKDTVTTTSELSFTFGDGVKNDTIVVIGIGKYGYVGKDDTIYIQVVERTLDIALVNFPVEIPARRWTEYRVVGLNSRGDTLKEGVFSRILFSVKPDSEKVSSNGLKVYYRNNPGEIKVTAYVYNDKGDTSPVRESKVIVREFKPVTKVNIVENKREIWLGESLKFVVSCVDSNSDGKIVGKYCKIDGKDVELKNDTLLYTPSEPGLHNLDFWCMDNDSFVSNIVKEEINVNSKKLYFVKAQWDTTVYSGEKVTIRASVKQGESGVPIVKWKWDIGGDGVWDKETDKDFIDTSFVGEGEVKVVVGCEDAGGDSAETLAVRIIHLLSTRPVVLDVKIDRNKEIWIRDSVRCVVKVKDNGVVEKYYLQKEAGTEFVEYSDSVIFLTYATAGEKKIRIFAVDNDGEMSDTIEFSGVTVKLGKPVVTVIEVSNKSDTIVPDEYYLNDTIEVNVNAIDTNGTIKGIYVSGGGEFKLAKDRKSSLSYSDSGKKIIRAYVIDDDGVVSDTVSKEIIIKRGAPTITNIKLFGINYYVNDSIMVIVKGRDVNKGYIVGGKIKGNEVDAQGDSLVGWVIFGLGDSGSQNLDVVIRDDDGNEVDSSITLFVHSGMPYVDSVNLILKDSVLWVRDSLKLRIVFKDPNSELKKVGVDFGVGVRGRFEKEYEEGIMSIEERDFWIVYDTTECGERSIRIWCEDEDGYRGEKELKVMVRKGEPVVRGERGDTIFVRVDRGVGEYYYRPVYLDSNGVIDTFYFGLSNDINNATKMYRVDSAEIYVDESNINKVAGIRFRYIWVKDDDGYVRGGKFIIFADSAPPVPTLFIGSSSGDTIVLKWKKVMDAKDSLDTRVQIEYCYGDECQPTTKLYDENELPTLRELEERFGVDGSMSVLKFKKDPTIQSGTFGRWRVILVDSVGNRSVCSEGCPATFIVP